MGEPYTELSIVLEKIKFAHTQFDVSESSSTNSKPMNVRKFELTISII